MKTPISVFRNTLLMAVLGLITSAFLSLAGAFTAQAAPKQTTLQYQVIFLGTFGGDQSYATAINDLDDVAGYGLINGFSGYNSRAFLYKNGKLLQLPLTSNATESSATAINHYDQVVGKLDIAVNVTHAFVYRNGKITDLGTLTNSTGEASQAFGINDSGAVVGIDFSNGGEQAFLYHNGKMTGIAGIATPDFTFEEARAINNCGQIVGVCRFLPPILPNGVGNDHAALFQNGSIVDLGTLKGSATSIALAINNWGQIVGGSFFITSPPSSGEYHAFLYKSGIMNDIGNGIATGINDNGEVVGEGNDGTSYGFAFLYTITRGLVNLNNYVVNLSNGTTPGFTKLLNANAINGQGDIVGFGNYFDGTKTVLAGFLLIKSGK